MNLAQIAQIKKAIRVIKEAEDQLLDLPLDWQEEAAERDIDTLHTVNTLSEIADFLEDKLSKLMVRLER